MTTLNAPRRRLSLAMSIFAACPLLLAASGSAQSINHGQLARILAGETIPEAAPSVEVEKEYTEEFFIDDCRFSPTGENMFMSLRPGHQVVLAGTEEGVRVELAITVLKDTKTITVNLDGKATRLRARVIEERETRNGVLAEVSRNFYARCLQTNDIFCFGEEVCVVTNGVCSSSEGSWLIGQGGAEAGVMMPGSPMLGARYFHQQAAGVAMDRAEHTKLGFALTTPAGTFDGCLAVAEDTELDEDAEGEKVYAPGVGLIQDGPLLLVSHRESR